MSAPLALLGRLRPYLIYPFVGLLTAGYLLFELHSSSNPPGRFYGLYLSAMVVLLVAIETRWPLRPGWGMSSRLFWRRDLPYLALGAATLGCAQWMGTQLASAHGIERGTLLAGMPVAVGTIVTLALGDFIWYWVHRASHELSGRAGRFAWRLHAAHHQPAEVYVLMHPIGHPINTLLVRVILTVPAYLLGVSAQAAFVASVLLAFQGLVSHFNTDCRAGFVNRALIGCELHRIHHSADPLDRGNYGAFFSIWDQLFGTYRDRIGQPPQRLGLEDEATAPPLTAYFRALVFPFRRM